MGIVEVIERHRVVGSPLGKRVRNAKKIKGIEHRRSTLKRCKVER
jgi:hypothetical protein